MDFLKLANQPLKFRLFMFMKLPSAFFSGVRIREADAGHCVVSVPFKWFTQNPFRSTYFACLAMAAEMSTGILAMAHVYRRSPAVSMLVVGLESNFHKKATGKTLFSCEDGAAIKEAVESSTATGESRTVRARSIGRNEGGEVVAEFFITWSFKAKSK